MPVFKCIYSVYRSIAFAYRVRSRESFLLILENLIQVYQPDRMSKFANLYWSPDYESGIQNLGVQLHRSLSQLHELRKLVFNYMKLYHSNGEYLATLAQNSFSPESGYHSVRRKQPYDSRKKDSSDVNISYLFLQYVQRATSELQEYQALASDIDRSVLEQLTVFIKQHEPQINKCLNLINELLLDYQASYQTVEQKKIEFDSIKRTSEFSAQEADAKRSKDVSKVEKLDNEQEVTPIHSPKQTRDEKATQAGKPSQAHTFNFPLSVGNVLSFNDLSSFSDYFLRLVDAIPITRRTIPLPGYRNEIFSSDQLCEYLLKGKAIGFNPSRLNLEKFGQGLIDLKIIVGTGFFAKKFACEGKWYEWSDDFLHSLGRGVSKSSDPLLPSLKLKALTIEDVNEMALTTSRRFNGMFKSMKTSLMKPKYSEDAIKAVEVSYNEQYQELEKAKHLLDVELINGTQYLESFEKLKIKIIYNSLTKLLEILHVHSLNFSEQARVFSQRFKTEINKPEFYTRDFESMVSDFSCGIYFPSNISPELMAQKHFMGHLNTNFQNINLEFNLFKDIPLQATLSSGSTGLLTLRSVPKFLYEVVKVIEDASSDFTELKKLWLAPLDHQMYWLMKNEIIIDIQAFQPTSEVSVLSVNNVESEIIQMIIDRFKTKSVSMIVNFLKNWCLEIGDSVIPSTVYDSLMANYSTQGSDIESQEAEAIRILSAIPRSNLSSLLFILHHFSKVLDIYVFDEFGLTDDIHGPVSTSDDREKLQSIAVNCNRMDVVGSVPLLHLFMRPSVAKNSSGFIPPIEKYNVLFGDLLQLSVRLKLMQALVLSERKYLERQEQQRKNLGIIKKTPEIVTDSAPNNELVCEKNESKKNPLTPRKMSNASQGPPLLSTDAFELRPFRTGTTPRSSPLSSPVRQERQLTMPKSPSTNFLKPIDINITLHDAT